MPVSVALSVGLHAGALALFLYSRAHQPQQPKIISNVALLIQSPQSPNARTVAPPVKPTTWNFLKLALPSLPKAIPQAMAVKLPNEPKPLMAETPKLTDRGQRMAPEQMKALDLNRSRQTQAQGIQEHLSFSHGAQAMAALPRLQDVGERQVADLPQAIKLDNERRQAQAMQVLGAAENLPAPQVAQAPAPLQEAAPEPSGPPPSALSSILPSQELSMAPQQRPEEAPALNALPLPKQRRKAAILPENKKGVDIEGPLADRKILHYEIPSFPDWARQEGVLEADVAIHFWVSPDGTVQPDMSIERTSGYGRLDHLAMKSLARWRFAPINTNERQWGIITFRFVLE
ncbi:MAG: TonB family protein [Elusimicrobia bacterium]|nr:TonB family protein [Elusimicrobiota bacterium]